MSSSRANGAPVESDDQPGDQPDNPCDSVPLIAAAICHLAAVDPTMFDPSGKFIDATWPWATPPPGGDEDPLTCLDRAIGLIATAQARFRFAAMLDSATSVLQGS